MCNKADAQKKDTLRGKDLLRYPIKDRRGDRYSWNYNNPFDLNDSNLIKQNIQYDPKTNQYYIEEKVGDLYYRKPTYLSFDEFWKLQNQQSENYYFNQRSRSLFDLNR
ncbi:MAG TPA: hypothetical protein PL045_12770, partial [Chitinophagaceae bacterium]|nr:hypothetical protein [Chitinophagaceae bacterium]